MALIDIVTSDDEDIALLCMTYGGYAEDIVARPADESVWGFDCVEATPELETDLRYRPLTQR